MRLGVVTSDDGEDAVVVDDIGPCLLRLGVV